MSQCFRRLYSISTTGSSSSASQIAAEFLQRMSKHGEIIQEQFLDANQLQRLSLTLGRKYLFNHPRQLSIASSPPPVGTPIPPGYHLVYFTPSALERDLGKDGSERTFNPMHPFTRRMWAGGEITWTHENHLAVGQTVKERTKLVRAEPKFTKDGEEMIVVGVEKTFENESGLVLVDKRNWVFRKEITSPIVPVSKPALIPFPEGKYIRDFTQTPISLFRFSALTFNAHQIHYSRDWCRQVEGHRDAVVHGPLNLINMLDFWRDTVAPGDDSSPNTIRYRATAPLYVGETYRVLLETEAGGKKSSQVIYTLDGKVAMRGEIE